MRTVDQIVSSGELERIIDSSSLRIVTEALSIIAAEKGNHIVGNWQDRPTAAPWFRASTILYRTSETLKKIGV